jgi:hypothetical protein
VGGVGEEGRVGGEVVPLELLHQVRHLRRRRREGRRGGGLGHRVAASPAREELLVAGLAFELGWRRERVGLSDRGGGWWPLDREMDGSDRGRQSRCSRRC